MMAAEYVHVIAHFEVAQENYLSWYLFLIVEFGYYVFLITL